MEPETFICLECGIRVGCDPRAAVHPRLCPDCFEARFLPALLRQPIGDDCTVVGVVERVIGALATIACVEGQDEVPAILRGRVLPAMRLQEADFIRQERDRHRREREATDRDGRRAE
jgi:hypothetical protein